MRRHRHPLGNLQSDALERASTSQTAELAVQCWMLHARDGASAGR